MAGVYRAYDERLRVWRAAKVLFPEFAGKRKIRKRFEREAHTMARLEHPNLVRVVDVGHSGALPFIVMELVPCGTLMQWVDRHGPMPERLAVDVILQVCEAVREVHRNGVVHRDIKPHNVLINELGVCKLTDFGIAQDDSEDKTKAGSVMGTMGYMAPEQRNDASSVDERADIYGVAATLWKLITNGRARDLFMYSEDAKILEGVSPGLGEVLMACFAYSRDDRPERIDDVMEALAYLREEMPPLPASTPALPVDDAMGQQERVSDTFEEISPAFTMSHSGYSEVSLVSEPMAPPPEATPPPSSPTSSSIPGPPPSWSAEAGASFPPMAFATDDAAAEPEPESDPGGRPDLDWLVSDDATTEEDAFGAAPSQSDVPEDAATRLYVEETDEVEAGYIAESEAPREKRVDQTIGMEGSAPTKEPTAPPPAQGMNPLVGLLLKLGVAGALLFCLILGGLLAWGTTTVRNASDVAMEARRDFYLVLDQERLVVSEMVQLDRSASVLEGLYLDFLDQKREPARREAAERFLDELSHYHERLGTGGGNKSVTTRVNKLERARQRDVEQRQAWEDAAGGFPGVFATVLGVAPSP